MFGFYNTNPNLMEKQMNLKRAFLILIAALLLPGMAMAQDARFLVSKNFIDDNDASIEVMISCNTGVPLEQSATISQGNGVGFVVAGFDPDLGTCTITEDGEAGYTGSYLANAGVANPISCVFDSSNWNTGEGGADQTCVITNAATPIQVTITKAWNMEGAGGEAVDTNSVFRITSEGEITGGGTCPDAAVGGPSNGLDCAILSFSGPLPETDSVLVTPADGGTSVLIQELNFDSSVEVSYDCGGTNSGTGNSASVTIVPGGPAPTCAFTNTVFFEGIPTLNQYGMAILALLMLGVGFVGFRRFA